MIKTCRSRLFAAFCGLLCFTGLGQGADVEILRTVNGQPLPGWDNAMKNLSAAVYVIGPAVPVAISLHGYFKKDKDLMMDGFKSAISLCGAIAISTCLKYSLDRTRPFVKYPTLIDGRDSPHTPSFPSGHTTSAFCTATSLSLTYRKWYVVVPAFTYAGMTAYSRMRLGVHYPSDVIGGIIIGTGTTLLTWHLHKLIRRKKDLPRVPGE